MIAGSDLRLRVTACRVLRFEPGAMPVYDEPVKVGGGYSTRRTSDPIHTMPRALSHLRSNWCIGRSSGAGT